MNWTDEPATEPQINQLRRFGYQPAHPLTRGEAAHLLRDLEAHSETPATMAAEGLREITKQEAHGLRVALENARRAVTGGPPDQAQHELAAATAKRQQFWVDTCCDPGKMQAPSAQVLELYMRYGCRFLAPTHEQAQEILDALDLAMPIWDRDHPDLFYQTLELNFRELLRHA
jgi:hypothetical protein